MRLDHTSSPLKRFIEKLRNKWINFTNGIVLAITEDEMKIRREETAEQLRAPNQSGQARGASQS
jgi:hypothetical protein